MTSRGSLIQARLDAIRDRNPHLLSVAAAAAMMVHLDEPYDLFLPYIELPVEYVDDDALKQLAKLTSFARISIHDLRAFIFRRFAVSSFRQLPKAPVEDILDTYRSFGVTVGPQMFRRYVQDVLAGGTGELVI